MKFVLGIQVYRGFIIRLRASVKLDSRMELEKVVQKPVTEISSLEMRMARGSYL